MIKHLRSALVIFVMLTSVATAEVIRLSEPVEQTAETETFGSPFDESTPLVNLEAIADDGQAWVGRPIRVVASVSEVCQKKGCFFIAREGQSIVRVSFKDYSFFVPTDISGRRVALIGEVVAREVSADEAKHFAEDLGTPEGPVKAGMAYEIVATSVRVPRN